MNSRASASALAKRIAAAAVGVAVAGSIVAAQTVKNIGTFSSWTAFTHGEGGSMLCFATAQPTKQEPANAKRNPAFIYVSSWPKDGVKAEISVRIGYAVRKDSDVTVAVGSSSFKLFGSGDRAYVADATEEQKLLEVMRRGSTLTVKGMPDRGTATTDTYSLAGISQALNAVSTTCK